MQKDWVKNKEGPGHACHSKHCDLGQVSRFSGVYDDALSVPMHIYGMCFSVYKK